MKTSIVTRKRRVVCVLAAVVVVAVSGPIQVSRGDTAVGANLFDPGDPWLNPNYQPKPGKWQPYLRSPLNRNIYPIRVLAVLPRGGRVAGDPNRHANATAVLTGVANRDRAKRALNYLQTHNWSSLGALTVSPKTPNPSVAPFYSPLPSGFEVEARLTANDPTGQLQLTALQLMRSFWGYQLSQDPGSSFWEHVEPDGTPNLKQFSSLAHGWAAGPVISLTTEVLGVQPTSPGFSSYAVIPHPADLAWVQGRVPTPYGPIDASWQSEANSQFTMHISAPVGTTGQLVVPILGRADTVEMDGQIIFAGQARLSNVKSDGATVSVGDVTPGHHRLLVRH
jgi:hypothetical protein